MNHWKHLAISLLLGMLVFGLVGCAQEEMGSTPAGTDETAASETETAGDDAEPTPSPTSTLEDLFGGAGGEEEDSVVELAGGVSAIGEVHTAHDADLVFSVQGTVQHVYIEEGSVVTKGQLLASLDVRTFDQQIKRAEAGVMMAEASEMSLDEPPRAADLEAANAQIAQAEANLAYILEPPEEVDVKLANANLALAEVNLQATRDRLSFAKTQSELQVKLSAYQLTQAQWQYALAQRYWEHADDHETDPVVPETTNPMTGEDQSNTISEGKEASYRTSFEQAQASMQQAEEALNVSLVAAEGARRSEVTGVQVAEHQVVQAQIGLEKTLLPPNENQVNQAQAAVNLAAANRARLYPDPKESQRLQVDAQRLDAESSLELARLNREYAELYAPFDGVISDVNIDPGDPAMSGIEPAVSIVDVENVHVEVDISDIDIAKIDINQPAMIYADALPGEVFNGKVSYIAPSADVQGSLRTYKVKIKLDDTEGLRPGMSVRVEIETEGVEP